jgi:hypothetical protein
METTQNILPYLKDKIGFVENVIAEEGYIAANSAIWEFYSDLKNKLKEPPKVPMVLPPKVPPHITIGIPEKQKAKLNVKGVLEFSPIELAKIRKLVQDGEKPGFIAQQLGLPAERLYYTINRIKEQILKERKETA